MSRTFAINTKPYDDCRLFNRKNIIIESGLTVLVGCNGTGKTTLLNEIRYQLERKDVPFLHYDNYHDGGSSGVSRAIFNDNISLAATLFCSSEGEKISQCIAQQAKTMGNFVGKNKDKSEIWFLFDAIDGGFSIDNIDEVKSGLFKFVIDHCKEQGQEVYIVVSANSYEMVNGENCLDVWEGKYMRFQNYDEYKKFIMKTRKRKDKRHETTGLT